jgi:uncharacterized protein DUF6968
MPSQMSFIASRRLAGINSSRGTFEIVVSIGQPYQCGPDEWACPIALDGLHASLRDAHGHDAFQALMLAQKLARQLLTYFVEDGGKLLHEPDGSVVSIQDLFDGGTSG